jgi:hypothetical protein
MHPISLIFLGLCAFLLGFWLVRRLERRKVKSSGPQVIIPPSKSVHTSPVYSVEANRESSPIEPAQPADVNQEPAPVEHHDIRDLILENHQSEAIKLLHEQKGWGLRTRQKNMWNSRSNGNLPSILIPRWSPLPKNCWPKIGKLSRSSSSITTLDGA